jgi:hypothetical protein
MPLPGSEDRVRRLVETTDESAAAELFLALCRASSELRHWLWEDFARDPRVRDSFRQRLRGRAATVQRFAELSDDGDAWRKELRELRGKFPRRLYGGLTWSQLEKLIARYRAAKTDLAAFLFADAWHSAGKRAMQSPLLVRAALDLLSAAYADPRLFRQHRPRLLDQYVTFTQADIEQRIDVRIAEIGQALEAARGELAGIEQEREIVLAQLDQRARVAERRLVDLDKASRMPDTIAEWSGRSFIHVKIPASHDAVERKQRLGLLLNGWIREAGESIPDGVSLAYETLMAVVGDRSITMKILKPEYQLLPEIARRPLTDGAYA